MRALLVLVLALALVGCGSPTSDELDRVEQRGERQQAQLRSLERRVDLLREDLRDLRPYALELGRLVCVMAHVDDRAERLLIRDFERRGRLLRSDVLADYPGC